jgi:hypothetical protein
MPGFKNSGDRPNDEFSIARPSADIYQPRRAARFTGPEHGSPRSLRVAAAHLFGGNQIVDVLTNSCNFARAPRRHAGSGKDSLFSHFQQLADAALRWLEVAPASALLLLSFYEPKDPGSFFRSPTAACLCPGFRSPPASSAVRSHPADALPLRPRSLPCHRTRTSPSSRKSYVYLHRTHGLHPPPFIQSPLASTRSSSALPRAYFDSCQPRWSKSYSHSGRFRGSRLARLPGRYMILKDLLHPQRKQAQVDWGIWARSQMMKRAQAVGSYDDARSQPQTGRSSATGC